MYHHYSSYSCSSSYSTLSGGIDGIDGILFQFYLFPKKCSISFTIPLFHLFLFQKIIKRNALKVFRGDKKYVYSMYMKDPCKIHEKYLQSLEITDLFQCCHNCLIIQGGHKPGKHGKPGKSGNFKDVKISGKIEFL